MRNPLRLLTLVFVATVGVSLPAAASPYVYQDTFNPDDVFLSANSAVSCTGENGALDTVTPPGTLVAPCQVLSYTHVLAGFAPEDLTAATFTVYFRDDGGPADGSEKFTVTGDGSVFWSSQEPGGSGNSVAYGPLSVMGQFVDNEYLNIVITANNGDLWFERSVLDATWDDGLGGSEVVPTPEPASLLLFGVGIAAVAHRIRKSRRA